MKALNTKNQCGWVFLRSLKLGLPLVVITVLGLLVVFATNLMRLQEASGYGSDKGNMWYRLNTDLISGIVVAALMLAVVLGFLFFRYLYKRGETDFYHALPVTRGSLFFGKILAALVCLLVPQLVGLGLRCVFVGAFSPWVGQGESQRVLVGVLVGTGVQMLMSMAALALVILAAMLSTSLFQGIMMLGAFSGVGPAILLFGMQMIRLTVPAPHIPYSLDSSTLMGRISPLFALLIQVRSSNQLMYFMTDVFWWLGVAALLGFVAYRVYKKRDSALPTGAHKLLKQLLSILVGLAAALFAAAIFGNQTSASPMVYASGIVAAAFASGICMMLFFGVQRVSKRELMPCTLAVVLFVGCGIAISTGLGMDTAYHKVGEVQWADAGKWNDTLQVKGQTTDSVETIAPASSVAQIEQTLALQKALVACARAYDYPYALGGINAQWNTNEGNVSTVTLRYGLKQGSGNYRYAVPTESKNPAVAQVAAQALTLHKNLYADQAYLSWQTPINAVDAVTLVKIVDSDGMQIGTKPVSDSTDKAAFLQSLEAALRADFQAGRSMADKEDKEDTTQSTYFLVYSSNQPFTARGGQQQDGSPAAGKEFYLTHEMQFGIYPAMTETYKLLQDFCG